MPDFNDIIPVPHGQPEVTDFLSRRRSNMAKMMSGPGPDAQQLSDILRIAARVPDHRKLAPWRFVIFEGKARSDFGQIIASVFGAQNPDMPLDKTLFESARLMRAPTVVAVISSPKDCVRGTPLWEQQLSAGAVCHTMLLAAQSMGFAAQWLTEWFSYDAQMLEKLGVEEGERVAGFIYLGSTTVASRERARPDVASITRHWV